MKPHLYGLASVIAIATVTSAALAQTSAEVSDEGLAEIVVTAQKRAQNLQDVPIAVNAVSGQQLAASGVTVTYDLPAISPGLSIRSTAGSFQPYIRGIGTSSSVVENPVSLYVDGVYFAQQREGLLQLNDVDQIAVLKGPQGTLFGRNATGGVIQITTRKPQEELYVELNASVDNYAYSKADVYVTGGLADGLAASFSGQYATQGRGWGESVTTGHDTYRLRHYASVRAKFLYEAGPDTTLTFIGDYMDRDALANSFQNYPGTQLSFINLAPLKSRYDTYSPADTFVAFRGGGVSLTVDHKFASMRLVSISSFRKGRGSYLFDNTSDPAGSWLVRAPNLPNKTYTQELQLIGDSGPIQWVAGAYYFHNLNGARPNERTLTGAVAPLPTSVTINSSSGDEVSESIAMFAQADWEFLPGTTATFGARYTFEERKVDTNQTLTRNNGVVSVVSLKDKLSVEKPSFRVALSHKFTDNILGYVSFNSSFKSGGYNIVNSSNPAYRPETLKAYEVGVKSELFDRAVRINLAGFYYDYSNVQVIQFVGGFQSVSNGAKAKLYGLDADIEVRVADGLRLSGGFLIEHSEFTNYPNAVFAVPNPAGGGTLSSRPPLGAKGNRLPLAQEFVGTIAVDYRTDLRSGGTLDLNLTANYNGDYYFEPDNFLRQKSYVMLNASAKWTLPGDRISLSIWGKNLADEAIIQQPSAQAIGFPTTWGTAPRTYGASVQFRF